MAILDAVEVSIRVPGENYGLQECDLPLCMPHGVPWAVGSKGTEKYLTVPEGKIFEIRIRLGSDFNFEGADGVHISLSIDDGKIVNHYYSIKFADFIKDEKGDLIQTISSAIITKMNDFRSIRFSFGSTHRSMSAPLGYYGQGDQFPEGRISVTVIRVNHCDLPLRLATTTKAVATREAACSTMVPVDAGKVPAPIVTEQVLPVEPPAGTALRFVFRYRTLPAAIFQHLEDENKKE